MAKKTKTKKGRKLDFKQQRFCEEYIIDWNQTQAAIRVGYSPKSARQVSSRLMTNANIQDYISKCKNKIEELAGVSKLRAVKKLTQIAFADIAEAYNEDGSLKDLKDIPNDIRAAIEGIETINIGEGISMHKLKAISKRGAIQDLAKMLGWNEPDKIEHSGDINIEI